MRESERTDFDGKVALVTGAAQGLGAATARAFAIRGAAVCLVDRDGAAEQVAADLRLGGARAIFVRADVSAANDAEMMVATTVQEFGRLDFAYNNAGVLQDDRGTSPDAIGPVGSHDRREPDGGVPLDARRSLRCSRAAMASHRQRLVDGRQVRRCVDRNRRVRSNKAGVLALTRAAARDYAADGIRAVSICPGPIETDMVRRAVDAAPDWGAAMVASRPMKRLGTVDEIAGTVVWLCSPAAGYITGEAIAIDGAAYC